ncbi:MAG: AAA family ATPase [Acidimicrobiia bacterium]|nr:AAA family ATPase [Acidimicrobiia bacterium]MDQ3308156.1 AAA family ATPase [Actinomycetota bacterium]
MTEHDGPDEPAAAERSAIDLTLPQADAACAVAGDADLVLVVGPAGTGKTTALRPAQPAVAGLQQAFRSHRW